MILGVKKLTKICEDKIVVDNVEFGLEKGKMLYILGPSSCGKSTILNIIGGFVKPNSEQIILDGGDIINLIAGKRDITTVSQSYGLFYHVDVLKNIAYGLKFENVEKTTIENKINEMIELVGLKGHEKKMVDELSGEQRQRVALARSLVLGLKLLLLDGPLSNLDQRLRVGMRLLVRNVQKNLGATMISIIHGQNEAFELTDDIILMNKGRTEQHSYPLDIYKNPRNNFVLNFISDKNISEGYYVRPEDARISEQGEDGIIEDIMFQDSSVRVEIQLGEKTIDSYMLNNDFKSGIGDKVKVVYLKEKSLAN